MSPAEKSYSTAFFTTRTGFIEADGVETATNVDEFRRDAVRIALTSGLTRRQVSTDLGVGLSTLNKWIKVFGEDAVVTGPDQDLARENERLRRENRILKEERDVPYHPSNFGV